MECVTIGSATLYNMDCLEAMRQMPDNAFELAIVDPPYGININHNIGRRKGDKHSGHKRAVWDSQPPPAGYFAELFRVSVKQIIWGANHFISLMPYDSPCWLMWDKGFSEDVTFAQFELAWTSFNGSAKKYDRSPQQPDKIHPTQKPVQLYRWVLNRFAKPGDRILDTHHGSGSNAIACIDMGFEITAYELDPDYFKAACERIDRFMQQPKLF